MWPLLRVLPRKPHLDYPLSSVLTLPTAPPPLFWSNGFQHLCLWRGIYWKWSSPSKSRASGLGSQHFWSHSSIPQICKITLSGSQATWGLLYWVVFAFARVRFLDTQFWSNHSLGSPSTVAPSPSISLIQWREVDFSCLLDPQPSSSSMSTPPTFLNLGLVWVVVQIAMSLKLRCFWAWWHSLLWTRFPWRKKKKPAPVKDSTFKTSVISESYNVTDPMPSCLGLSLAPFGHGHFCPLLPLC